MYNSYLKEENYKNQAESSHFPGVFELQAYTSSHAYLRHTHLYPRSVFHVVLGCTHFDH